VLFDPGQTGDFASELAQAARQEQVPPWCSYIGWQGAAPVTMGGFKGPPNEAGEVELGYLTFAAHQGRGHACAIAAFLVSVARDAGVPAIIAHTLPETNASTRVLEKTGFVRDGDGLDEDVGLVWRWRHAG